MKGYLSKEDDCLITDMCPMKDFCLITGETGVFGNVFFNDRKSISTKFAAEMSSRIFSNSDLLMTMCFSPKTFLSFQERFLPNRFPQTDFFPNRFFENRFFQPQMTYFPLLAAMFFFWPNTYKQTASNQPSTFTTEMVIDNHAHEYGFSMKLVTA